VREFDLAAGRVVRERKGHRGYVRSVAYTRAGRELLTSADDGSIRIWGEGDTPEKVLEGHRGGVLSIALSPDDALVLSGGRDGTVRLWDRRRAALLHTWEGHRGWVEAVLFSSDGRFACSAGRDGRILRRAVESGQLVGEMVPGGRVLSLAGTPDGRLLFAGNENGAITCWNADTGKQVRKLEGHAGPINALAITPDGKRLLSASEDTTLLVWNVPAGG
jgi:WD40 repeat protein